ncbi:hypothetical protein VP1G_11485 [Cytospora mali]|uniref:Uncharacterized protein n=1 Tax=Cytospora mali TaxID=578113 RepID=A0A194VG66_CYTMA|nr:hypothetical protein VP1G_11485 [Valsa mali var. pyri (nom. inval.)]
MIVILIVYIAIMICILALLTSIVSHTAIVIRILDPHPSFAHLDPVPDSCCVSVGGWTIGSCLGHPLNRENCPFKPLAWNLDNVPKALDLEMARSGVVFLLLDLSLLPLLLYPLLPSRSGGHDDYIVLAFPFRSCELRHNTVGSARNMLSMGRTPVVDTMCIEPLSRGHDSGKETAVFRARAGLYGVVDSSPKGSQLVIEVGPRTDGFRGQSILGYNLPSIVVLGLKSKRTTLAATPQQLPEYVYRPREWDCEKMVMEEVAMA